MLRDMSYCQYLITKYRNIATSCKKSVNAFIHTVKLVWEWKI